jgi:hypothetical protein
MQYMVIARKLSGKNDSFVFDESIHFHKSLDDALKDAHAWEKTEGVSKVSIQVFHSVALAYEWNAGVKNA